MEKTCIKCKHSFYGAHENVIQHWCAREGTKKDFVTGYETLYMPLSCREERRKTNVVFSRCGEDGKFFLEKEKHILIRFFAVIIEKVRRIKI